MKINFKTIYTCINNKFLIKGDLSKLRHKGKSRSPVETRGRFNKGRSIKSILRKLKNVNLLDIGDLILLYPVEVNRKLV